jgi:hypothetical protein
VLARTKKAAAIIFEQQYRIAAVGAGLILREPLCRRVANG